MNRTSPIAWALTLLLALAGGVPPALAALPFSIGEQPLPSLAPMLEKVTPAVVNIATTSRVNAPENPLLSDPFFRHFFNLPKEGRKRERHSLGSGVIVNAREGTVLTNHHVIDQADAITVTLHDGRRFAAEVVGVDKETDVAVIRIRGENLTALPMGDSDKVKVGDFVVAIGNPFELGQTVTSGIVSALGRNGLGIEGYEDFIQTDASINPGNSGGALVNLKGELVGINTAILAPGGTGNVGIGFAIPMNMARAILEQLVSHGEVHRGLLGVQAQDLTPELAEAFGIQPQDGAVVSRVVTNSGAARAGLQAGDILLEVNGRRIQSASQLRNAVGLLRVGEDVRLKLLRDKRPLELTAEVTEPQRLRMQAGELHRTLAGATLEDVEGEEDPGLVVSKVEPRSSAWNAGLRPGDRVFSINRVAVNSFAEATAAIKRNREQILLGILRGKEELFILIQPRDR